MKLSSLTFSEFDSQPSHWYCDPISFGPSTLIVGRNSTGKSRIINVIHGLSKIISGRQKEVAFQAKFSVNFSDTDHTWVYTLNHDNDEVQNETLEYDGKQFLYRAGGGLGRIQSYNSDEQLVSMRIQVPRKQLALVAKRDAAQHPYLESIHKWAETLRCFRFGSEMESQSLTVAVHNAQLSIELDEKDTNRVVPILHAGMKKYEAAFQEKIIKDMAAIGYDLQEVSIAKPPHTLFHGFVPGEIVGVTAKESSLDCITNQLHMSTGMFRALSLLIQLNYYILSGHTGCILVDDIGDGLDFERTCTLIDLIREKAAASNVQLIMTTNNRFVMNRVPFEEWCVLHREGGHVRALNWENAKDKFEDFRFTGLSNFELFSSDFLFQQQT